MSQDPHTYAPGDRVTIEYSPSMMSADVITATGTIRELSRPRRFSYADHLVVDLDEGTTFSFDEGDDLALWSVVKL